MKLLLFLNCIVSCSGFMLSSSLKSFKNTPSIKMSYDPSEMIQTISKNGLGTEWTYNEFLTNLKDHNIDAATLTDTNNMVIIDKNYDTVIAPENLHLLKSIPDLTNNIVDQLINNHINFDIYNTLEQRSIWSMIPFPLQFIGIYFLLSFALRLLASRGMGNNFPGNPMNPMDFTRKNANEIQSSDIDVSFKDVAGCEESKYELMEIVEFLKNPLKFEASKAKIPSGVLLEGPPGTGKTLLARAVAGEAGVGFLSASGSEFIEMFVGVGASRVRNLFEKAKQNAPCVIFIDEIDAIGRQRGTGFNSGNDEREQTLNQILTNMDGFDKSTGIIVLGATNRADILDSALTRPGRFDRKVMVPLPDKQGRKEILNVHLKDKNYEKNLDLNAFAELTSGFSGADIANLVNEAAIFSVRYNQTLINKKCVLDAFEKTTIGLPKANDYRDRETIKLVAYHEAGHTLIAKLFDDIFDLRKITINANNNGAGGYTLFTPKEKYSGFPTKRYFLAQLMLSLGGRVAELLLFNNQEMENNNYDDATLFEGIDNLDITTGASNDLKQANQIARSYINLFGFNDTLGLYDSSNPSQPFLGRDLAMNGDKNSEYSKDKMDKEIERIINFAYLKTIDIMKKNKAGLDNIAKLLIDNISIDVDDIASLNIQY